MVSFKLCISDPSSGKSFQKEVKDDMAQAFVGLNIGESIKGDSFEFSGFEFQITGGSDHCGFPMRKGILGLRKKINLLGGIGFKGASKGIRRRKTVCGHKIHDKISQINLKVTKQGSKKLADVMGGPAQGAEAADKPNTDAKQKEKKEEPKDSPKVQKAPEKKDSPKAQDKAKEGKPAPKPESEPAEKK
jgi:small subunit ribosomal protein S6e